MSIYSDQFYLNQVQGAYLSGREYAEELFDLYVPQSVIDVGCGRGAWLKAFSDASSIRGVQQHLVGVDGPWNSKDDLILKEIEFFSVDLNELVSLRVDRKYDLLISVETAEHIERSSTQGFIDGLCKLSDVIVFSAAYEEQGGLYHVNERKHSDWAKFFAKNHFVPYDYFRPKLWGSSKVQYWYQQNCFLYVRKGAWLEEIILTQHGPGIKNFHFMDCVHPEAFNNRSSLLGNLKHVAQKVLPSSLVLFASNLKARISQ